MQFISIVRAGVTLALCGLTTAATLPRKATALDTISLHHTNDVRGNLNLPGSSNGHDITWKSSDASIVSESGRVTRQTEDVVVQLTASINMGNGDVQSRTIETNVRASIGSLTYEAYAFSYFTGGTGENIYFAASQGNDALTWTELNSGNPVLESLQGTKGLRDPFLIRSPEGDTFYLIATDLYTGGGSDWDEYVRHGSLYLEVWESNDLINWSEQRHIQVSPPNAGNTWAPEAYYDGELGAYLVFWASSLYDQENDPDHLGESYHRMLYAVTRDFVTFEEPVIWQDASTSRIDSTVLKESDTYYRFTKDEGAGGTGCTDIIQESSTTLRDTLDSWSIVASCIGRDAGTGAVEGPTVFKSNPGDVHGDKFYLFVDEYTGRGYIPLATDNIGAPDWHVPDAFSLPTSPRHGTVLPITAAELAALNAALGD